MAEFEQGNIDTSFEDLIIAQKTGVRQRALAVRAFVELTKATNGEATLETVNQIRNLTSDEAKKFRKAFTKATRLLNKVTPEIQVTQSEDTEVAQGNISVQHESLAEPVVEELSAEAAVEIAAVKTEIDEKPVEELVPVQKVEDIINVEQPAHNEEESSPKLDAASIKWLTGLIDDVENKTVDDIPQIVEELKNKRGPMNRATIDYELLVTKKLEGLSNKEIAQLLGSTAGSVLVTAANYKKSILRNESSSTEDAPKIVAETPKAPIPRPPKNPAKLHPIISEVPVDEVHEEALGPVENHEKKPDIDFDETIRLAVEKPSLVSESEWLEAAEMTIKVLAREYTSEEGANALWGRIHYDKKGQHHDATKEFKDAIENLRPQFSRVIRERFEVGSTPRIILQALFNNSMGYKSLDDIKDSISRKHKDPSVTDSFTQRNVVYAVSELLRP